MALYPEGTEVVLVLILKSLSLSTGSSSDSLNVSITVLLVLRECRTGLLSALHCPSVVLLIGISSIDRRRSVLESPSIRARPIDVDRSKNPGSLFLRLRNDRCFVVLHFMCMMPKAYKDQIVRCSDMGDPVRNLDQMAMRLAAGYSTQTSRQSSNLKK